MSNNLIGDITQSEFSGNALGASNTNVLRGGEYIVLQSNGDIANADNDEIVLTGVSAGVNGNGNQILLAWGNDTLHLDGSNNSISFSAPGPNTIETTTGSLIDNADGSIVLAGTADLNSATLSNGVATIQLGGGNVATISNVFSGSTIEYVDSSGTVSMRNLTDSSLQHVGGSLYEVTGSVLAAMDNTILDVVSGASLTLSGSSNTVILHDGAALTSDVIAHLNGNNNVIVGSTANGVGMSVGGNGNIVTLGANADVDDGGIGNTLTVGPGGYCSVHNDATATINATQGGTFVTLGGNAGVANADNDSIVLTGASAQVNGDGNRIQLAWGGNSLSLSGSNNTITFDTGSVGSCQERIQTASGYWVEEYADGTIACLASSVNLNDGAVTLGLGDGNIVTISNVRAGPGAGLTAANGQVNQLVAAMAVYSTDSASVSSPLLAQMPTESPVFASAHLHA
ncbi:hypothetical protein Q8F57_031755 [Paraburkholderia terrae]|uniref:hypothetical protein n=1 Tax=Paraburkholderia terrae TaxID=311230 RepID=UPI00296ADF11|nr:hypothetical protein [Paraburkholderia terrae]MDW3662472.1 hypothetical protein [Paraburkholderia terrae]